MHRPLSNLNSIQYYLENLFNLAARRLMRFSCFGGLLFLLFLPTTTKASQDLEAAELTYSKGITLLEAGELDSAIHYLQLAQVSYESLNAVDAYTSATTALAVCHYYLESYSQARKILEKAVQKTEASHPEFLGDFYDLLGPVYEAQGDLDRALSISLKSLDRTSGLDKLDERANLQNNIGAIYFGKGDFHHARDYYQAAYEHFKELQDGKSTAGALINLGLVEMRLNNYKVAREQLNQGLDLIPNDNSPRSKRQNILGNNHLALCWLELGSPDIAIALLNMNLDLYNPSPKEEAIIKANLGFCYHTMGEDKKAIQILEGALVGGQEILSSDQLATTYLHLGEAYQSAGNFQESDGAYGNGIVVMCKAAGFPRHAIRAPGIGDAPPPAVRISDKRTFFRLLAGKGRLNLQPKLKLLNSERMQTFQDAFYIMDLMRSELISPDARLFLSTYIRPFHNDAMALFASIPSETAFGYEVLERGKSLNLLESVLQNWQQNFSNVDQESVQQVREFQASVDAYERARFQAEQAGDQDQVQQFRQDILGLREQLRRLRQDQNAPAPLRDFQQNIMSLQRVKEYAKTHQTWVVEYGLSNELWVAIYIGPDTVITQTVLDKTATLSMQTSALRFSRMVSDWQGVLGGGAQELDTLCTDGWELYEALLLPLANLDDELPLIVIPDGGLHFLPFEALLTEAVERRNGYTGLPYLIHKRAVSYAYSGTLLSSIWDQTHAEEFALAPQCLAFAPGQGKESSGGSLQTLRDGNANLPGARQEVKALAQVFEGTYFFGADASEATFVKHLQENEPDIIHLAMHGIVDPEQHEYSYLSFDNSQTGGKADNRLYDYEIRQLNLSGTRLVVLSACETGIGEYVDGEGVLSLGRSFLQGGAESVIMSLWKLEDGASSELMGYFYQSLEEGVSRQEALRQAKLNYLATADDLHSHPAFWAGYLLQGDTSPLNPIASTTPWIYIGLGVLLILGLVLFIILRRGRKSN